MSSTEEERYSGVDIELWKAVLRYAANYRGRLLKLGGVMVLFAVADVMTPLMVKIGIDNFAEPRTLDGIGWFVAAFVVVAFMRSYLVSSMINIGGKLNLSVVYEVRRDCFNHLQNLSFSYFDHRPVGWLMARLTSDCRTLGNTLSWGVVDIVWGLAMMFFMAGIMLWMDFRLACVVLAIVPILLVVSAMFKKLMLAGFRRVREVNSKITGAVNEGIMGAQTTKTLVREEVSLAGFSKLTRQMSDVSVSAATRSSCYLPIVLVIGAVGTASVLWYGGKGVILHQASNGTGGVSPGILVAFLAYTVKFFQPVQDIAGRFAELQNAQAAAERIVGLLDTDPEVRDVEETVKPPVDFSGKIEMNNVAFHYLPEEPVLLNFNLCIKPGECVAIVGETGAGKTSLTNLVARFYEPVDGEILFDDINYRHLPLHWIHRQLGVVLQNPHLFRGSIAENIAYGRDDVALDDIKQAAALVRADGFISRLPGGYEFEVGEGGAGLSVGQKQLITFARAVLVNPRLMILDEATASIDTETEMLIQEAISEMLQGRTSLVVAHRLSTVRHADRIIVMEHGRILESGSHSELLRQRGHYYRLYTTQFVRQEVVQ